MSESGFDVFVRLTALDGVLCFVAEVGDGGDREEERVERSGGPREPELRVGGGAPGVGCEVCFLGEVEVVVLRSDLQVVGLTAGGEVAEDCDVIEGAAVPGVYGCWFLALWAVVGGRDVVFRRDVGEIVGGGFAEGPVVFADGGEEFGGASVFWRGLLDEVAAGPGYEGGSHCWLVVRRLCSAPALSLVGVGLDLGTSH